LHISHNIKNEIIIRDAPLDFRGARDVFEKVLSQDLTKIKTGPPYTFKIKLMGHFECHKKK
jgi:hypothetical protein